MGGGRRKSQEVTPGQEKMGGTVQSDRALTRSGAILDVEHRPGSADGGIGRDGLPLLVAGA
jgi:hypothetical protein